MASRQRFQITCVIFFLTGLACFMVAFADNPANGWFIGSPTENTKLDRYSSVAVTGSGISDPRAWLEVRRGPTTFSGTWVTIGFGNLFSHLVPAPSGDWGTTDVGNNGTITIFNCDCDPRDTLCGPVNVRFE